MRLQFAVQELRYVVQRDILARNAAPALRSKGRAGCRHHLLVVQHVIGEIATRAAEIERRDLGGQTDGIDRAGQALARFFAGIPPRG